MLLRQLFEAESSTYTYLLADEATGKAVIIDPVLECVDRDAELIRQLDLDLLLVLETHVHADHVTGGGELCRGLGAKMVLSERSGSACADRLVKHHDELTFGAHVLQVRETPGHTSGCLTYVLDTDAAAFTGDALLIRGCGRTDFQQGDASSLYRSVHGQIFSLPDATLLYPAHDYRGRTVTSVGEEKRWNPRLGGDQSEADFVELMHNLDLALPKKIHVAVPANLRCGLPDVGHRVQPRLDWAPVELSPVGVPQIDPLWVVEHMDEIDVVDVREIDEYVGELGHLAGSALLPLGDVATEAPLRARERPIVTVCRSGGRSGQAALQLLELGFERVASLAGGMRAWNEYGFPVQYGAEDRGGRQG